MDYNDFQILKEEEYKILEDNYKFHQRETNINTLVKEAINILTEIKISSLHIADNYNKKISNCLISAIPKIEKTLSNLQYIFHTDIASSQVKSCNIFYILKLYNTAINYLTALQQVALKQSQKLNFIIDINNLSFETNNLLTALSQSNITFYKYM